MDIGSIFLGLALLLVVAAIVARPLLEPADKSDAAQPVAEADQLRQEREQVLAALRELDFDHTMGKVADDDYAAQRARLVADGVAILKKLDEFPEAVAAPAPVDDEIEQAIVRRRGQAARPSPAAASLDDEIEASVAARRQPSAVAASDAARCWQCGAAVQPEDRFCPRCGVSQSVTCANCGHPARPDDKFCGSCGLPLPAPAGSLPVSARR